LADFIVEVKTRFAVAVHRRRRRRGRRGRGRGRGRRRRRSRGRKKNINKNYQQQTSLPKNVPLCSTHRVLIMILVALQAMILPGFVLIRAKMTIFTFLLPGIIVKSG